MTIEKLLSRRNATEINILNQVEEIPSLTHKYQYEDCDCVNCGDCACACNCDCGKCDGFYREVI